ncbi:MAG: cupin domain-containing protein [Anaerolineae bacterium]
MAELEPLEIVSISDYAGRLSEPFTMIDLVQIDDLTLSIYLCQGTMPRHRHLDQDELFLVHTGTISLESEWGTAILRPGELAVAPKGVAHRSSSLLHSLVLLLQPRLMVNRRNGHRRLFALKGEGRLEKVSLPAVGRQIATAFHPILVARLDTFDLNLTLCRGAGPWCQDEKQDTLVYCYDGQVTVDTGSDQVDLGQGDLIVVPKGRGYRLVSPERTLVVGVSRHRPPGLPLSD